MSKKDGQASTINGKQYQSLLNSISANSYPIRNTAIIVLSFKLMLRSKELAGLKINDVLDSDGNIRDVLRLSSSYTKGDKFREVPLSNPVVIKALQKLIADRRETDGNLFNVGSALFKTQRGNSFSASAMANHIKSIFVTANLNQCSSHSGRRTGITNLASNGVDIKNIATLAGHSNISTTALYIQTNPKTLAEHMKGL